jgi:hypothetical protein
MAYVMNNTKNKNKKQKKKTRRRPRRAELEATSHYQREKPLRWRLSPAVMLVVVRNHPGATVNNKSTASNVKPKILSSYMAVLLDPSTSEKCRREYLN